MRGERRLFAGLGMRLMGGEWLHVCGENGVGKSSLLRILAGLSSPDEGEIRWHGKPIREDTGEYHRELFFLGHHGAVKEEMSARENLELTAGLEGIVLQEGEGLAALARFGLRGLEDLPVRCLSAGQKRRVLLARLATRHARLWILDEPFNALDIRAVEMLTHLVHDHLEAGGMAVITSHQSIPLSRGRALHL